MITISPALAEINCVSTPAPLMSVPLFPVISFAGPLPRFMKVSLIPFSFKKFVNPPSNSSPLIIPNLARGCCISKSLMPFSSIKFLIPPNALPAKSIATLPRPLSLIDDPRERAPCAIPAGVS